MSRRPVYYTFGNHMHWVDMQWLWGYDVLPGSVRDMLRLCRETGARGCVNFDAIGYEKMAAECPDALAELREAVQAGTIEPVGCSYGQPYGLFHGGESNARQFTFGVRSVLRLLGVRPRTFWEEEFYFFPQLPQVLASCGFTGANLFFQWTWHTPEAPRERASLILWEGADGTWLPTLPRNELNVHQWPEDFDGLLEQGLIRELEAPAIVQWLELMPSRDWMCRSEVLLPRLKALFADPRFEVRPRTCGALIEELRGSSEGDPPVRAYTMDDVWHGMTLGKNGDRHPRSSGLCEQRLVCAEAISALLGLFGRPYPGWDVYPTWELEEGWREALAAQHHDNHECEGLCGFIGEASFERASTLANEVARRSMEALASRMNAVEGATVVFNGAGVPHDLLVTTSLDLRGEVVEDVPAFGYRVAPRAARGSPKVRAYRERGTIILERGAFRVDVDAERGVITRLRSERFPEGVVAPERPLCAVSMARAGGVETFDDVRVELDEFQGRPTVFIARASRSGDGGFGARVSLAPLRDTVDVQILSDQIPDPEPGMRGGLAAEFVPRFRIARVVCDYPFGIGRVEAAATRPRKYPTGDWMTSPQVFEDVHRPFTALRLVDLLNDQGDGLLITHDGSQQWFRTEDGVRCLLTARDPWDGKRYERGFDASLAITPHGPLTDAERASRAARSWLVGVHEGERGDLPDVFGPLEITGAPAVHAQAFFRESMKSGERLPDWAGHRMAIESSGACTHPFVIRLVEWNGEPAEVTLKLPGTVALAAKTNLMGECGPWPAGAAPAEAPLHLRDTGWLSPEPADPPDWARGAVLRGRLVEWSRVRFAVRPREIATVMADLVMGRKAWRDLDAKREVWATVHRTTEPRDSEGARA
ncbi:MAG: hypothetical protein DYG93_00930 [Leptolyngbya sp. PLA2]|nr:hypothetical protein [Leptolyngbya sp. PL-A2]MCQ3941388.1 hypothetical protein [cyanobacterium CYA1]MCZ7632931.1 hypothetical protein [Phycisphaerales bacterium]MDL1904499.1 hypothetical protein [Synechococcales cyanobacterium CNB]GIK18995.1 MAG: hypothetical protein BroJett004_11590 [Planctomycetota bacterium]